MLKCIGDLNLTGLTVVVDRGVYTVNVPPIVVLKISCGASHVPINPKTSYRSCHRSAKEALTRQLNSVRLANRLGLVLKECRSNQIEQVPFGFW